jgi:hypothetical protein
MATVRINLKSVCYPDVSPNCLTVLQSLSHVGFKVVLRNVYYKNKDKIVEYFDDRNIKISFASISKPDIDIVEDEAYIGDEIIHADNSILWESVDKYCLEKQIYERKAKEDYIPSYKDGFFLVCDYCLDSQFIDSKPISLKAGHTKGSKLYKAKPNIKTIDLVNSTTLEVVEHYDMKLQCFTPATELVYLNISPC